MEKDKKKRRGVVLHKIAVNRINYGDMFMACVCVCRVCIITYADVHNVCIFNLKNAYLPGAAVRQ